MKRHFELAVMMNPEIEQILDSVSSSDIDSVSKSALGNPLASLAGRPTWQLLDAPHNDQRTLAIVRCSGQAEVHGETEDWSCVVKIVNSSMGPNVAAAWNDPTLEEKVYELGLLRETGSPFRPAKCFGVSESDERLKLFWLEDLGGAPQPPRSVEEYLSTARHVGEFNGRMALVSPELPFDLPVDVHRLRRQSVGSTFSNVLAAIAEHSSHPVVREGLRDVTVESIRELDALCVELHGITPGLPHGMAFGDCHARNLFPLGDETVAIDWAGLALDPVGSDLSVLVGSALSWGVEEAVMVAGSETAIYEAYLDGLLRSGWSGDQRDVRRAFFTHLPLYLIFAVMAVDGIRSGRANDRKDWIETRRGAALAEIPAKMAPIIALIPGYVAELRELLH